MTGTLRRIGRCCRDRRSNTSPVHLKRTRSQGHTVQLHCSTVRPGNAGGLACVDNAQRSRRNGRRCSRSSHRIEGHRGMVVPARDRHHLGPMGDHPRSRRRTHQVVLSRHRCRGLRAESWERSRRILRRRRTREVRAGGRRLARWARAHGRSDVLCSRTNSRHGA